jgi:DNA (cytosine-5)-methyltransferase 1
MRYGSVCSGIEAASVAWEPLGWTPAWFCEIDPFPSAVLAHHYPQVPNHGDFTKLIDPAHPVYRHEHIDLLVGGTPCQAFSVAGLRQGLADARGGLTLEFLRLVRTCAPRWVVWENVPGVLSQDGGRAFGAFLGGLEDLGYGWAYRVLDAQYVRVDGYPGAVPQRRQRVFVVAHSGGRFDRAASVLLEPEGVHRNSPPLREASKDSSTHADRRSANGFGVDAYNHEVTGDFASALSTKSCHLRSLYATDVMASGQANAPVLSDGSAPTLTCLHEAPIAAIMVHPEVADVCGTIADGAHHGGGLNGQDAYTGRILPVAHGFYPTGGRDFPCFKELSPPVKVGSGGNNGSPPGVCITGDRTHALKAEGADASEDGTGRGVPIVASVAVREREGGATIEVGDDVAGCMRASQGGGDKPHALVGMSVRRLTPIECERLQGFPDDYTRIPWRGKPAEMCPDGGRYKALGNSMACNVMRWIGRRIELVDAV